MIPRPIRRIRCEVLIYDTLGSSWLHKCVPSSTRMRFLDIRSKRPFFFTWKFFFLFARNYLKYFHIRPGRRFRAYVFALLDTIQPKVIITFADNNTVLGDYSLHNPETLVIAIQNAIRGTVDSIPPHTQLPVYYSLGRAEKEVFKEIHIHCKEYIPVGSIKLGLFLEGWKEKPPYWDLSFCSHFRPELVAPGASQLFQMIDRAQRHLFQLTCRYAKTRGLSVAVLSKTREPELQESEESYFHALSEGYPVILILGNKSDLEFATYNAAFLSRLIINLCSTLGFEAFGVGRRVLFGSAYWPDLLEKWGAIQYYEKLPAAISLGGGTQSEFFDKADHLLNMESTAYTTLTSTAASYYTAMPRAKLPHEVIRERVSEHLNLDNRSP